MIIFGTGHRPEDCGRPFDEVVALARDALSVRNVQTVITGMAAGFDLAFAVAAHELGIGIWSVRPWAGHAPRKGDEDIYAHIDSISSIRSIVNSSQTYPGPWVYHDRNRFMVDNAHEGIAFWNGKRSGGTYACMNYAEEKHKKVTNIFPLDHF